MSETGGKLMRVGCSFSDTILPGFSDCSFVPRQDLSHHHLNNRERDPETQKALRFADIKDIGSAVVYALKIEAAHQASCKDRHYILAILVTD